MKQISIFLAMVAVLLGFSSCNQESDPKYKDPTTFKINTPALQDQVFLTSNDMTDNATFNLFCSQPDYGYSAICQYSALVSLDPQAALDKWVALPNETPTSAQMSIKTFELGLALNKLFEVADEDDFNNKNLAGRDIKCYFRAVCEIPGIEGSRIVSDNYVSYNKVQIQYAEKLPAWIYICGNVGNIETGETMSFLAPSMANFDAYKANFALYEPMDMIGEKLYVGSFNLVPKDSALAGGTGPDDCAQFRFFTELLGWNPDASLGSKEDDFYCLPITDKWASGYSGEIVNQGLGNWGVLVTELSPVTIVVDQVNLKIYVKEGVHEVSFTGRNPEFK